MQTIETEVLVIGGGATGAGIMRDLALRGIHSVLVEKQDLCAGASGGNHGLLHSGARYVSNDMRSAEECRREGAILKRIAPHCIEETGGLFVAVAGDDEAFGEHFASLCGRAGIGCNPLEPSTARTLEPALAADLVRAYEVPDATIDPFHLALVNVSHAEALTGSRYLPHCRVVEFERSASRLRSVLCFNERSRQRIRIVADQFVNAAGAWAMNIAALAGCDEVRLLWSKGTLLVSHDRLTDRVINRLRPPGDGDILVPGGTVSILGTTSVRCHDLEAIRPTVAEVDTNIEEARAMLPALTTARYIRAFSRVRPLVQNAGETSDREVARSFSLFDHSRQLENFCTITGGKLTTYRLMAEKAADLVAGRLGNREPCTSHSIPLPDTKACRWTEPGASPRYWYNAADPDDTILCECEMVPQSAITGVLTESPGAGGGMSLAGIALRTRAGKGPCQGSFCGIRITSHLYDQGHYTDQTGLEEMRDFFAERFKGMRSVIWGQQMSQMELAEALHCGLLGLDKLDSPGDGQ